MHAPTPSEPVEPTPRRRPRRRRVYGPGVALVDLLGWPTVAVTGAGFAGAYDWRLDLMSHFRLQYAAVLALVVVLALVTRRWGRAGLLTVAMGVNAWLVAALWLPRPVTPAPDGPTLTLVSANVLTDNDDKADALTAIAAETPDLFVLLEVDLAWIDAVGLELPHYRLVAAQPRGDNFGVAMFRRDSSPWDVKGRIAWMPPDRLPAIEAELQHPGGVTWDLLATHPLPPTGQDHAAARDETLQAVAAWTANAPGRPKLVVGDLNATPWSAAFRRLVDDAGLVDSQRGHGPSPTWPASDTLPRWLAPLAMIPIDHVLHDPALVTTERRTLSPHGSDHRFVLATVTPVAE